MNNNNYGMQSAGFQSPAPQQNASALTTTTASSREAFEIQSMMVIAKQFPRNEMQVLDLILNDCQRPGLAEKALYSYSRGGTDVTGPSIHLAKAIAKRWGNMKSGIVELEQRNGESVCEAYALDLESNYKESKTFTVPHIRHTKKGSYKLEDPRDIYELVANNGSRRERACLLSVFPGDIVEAAVRQCELTMKANADVSPENVKRMVDRFSSEFGVTKEQIEKRIQRRTDAITPAQMISLRNIYNSLKDGMSSPADWFEVVETAAADNKKDGEKKGNGKLADALGVPTAEKIVDNDFAPMITGAIKKTGAPTTLDAVIRYSASKNLAMTMDMDFEALVNTVAEADLI